MTDQWPDTVCIMMAQQCTDPNKGANQEATLLQFGQYTFRKAAKQLCSINGHAYAKETFFLSLHV